jgi:8-oxo-dGTP diphosphatase
MMKQDLTLVLMAGMPGTGKTTLALALGQSWGWPVIDKDSLKSPLLTGGVGAELAGPASYTLMLEIARDLLVKQHLSVILDSPGRFPFVLEQVKEMTERAEARLKIIRCEAPRKLRNLRLISRETRPSQWREDAGLSDEEEREMFTHLPTETLVLDTSFPLEDCLASAYAYLYQEEEQVNSEGAQMRMQMCSFLLKRQLAAVVLVNETKQLLLQYRGPDAPTSPHQWSLIGGGIEPGETAEEAALREVREETGLHLQEPLAQLWHGLLPSVSQLAAYNEWFVFLAQTQARQSDVSVGEGDAMIFFPLSQVFRLDLAPSALYLLSLAFLVRE